MSRRRFKLGEVSQLSELKSSMPIDSVTSGGFLKLSPYESWRLPGHVYFAFLVGSFLEGVSLLVEDSAVLVEDSAAGLELDSSGLLVEVLPDFA